MTQAEARPRIIQGGMGVGISNWRLARAVSLAGQLGVVSGTALDTVLVRRLQDGDPGGHMRRAMVQFPLPHASTDALRRYFRPEGKPPDAPYRALSMYRQAGGITRQRLTVLASFVEVYLAKEGHSGPVGLNLLTKVQLPNLASLYGAMLAGVDYVLMGAGIPREVPGVLDALAEHRAASLRFDVLGLPPGAVETLTLDPAGFWHQAPPGIRRPAFLPIVASHSLATMLARKANGGVDGLVIESPTAGGHNAPPRGQPRVNARGEPLYGERDDVDLARVQELGLPFWVAGGAGRPSGLADARRVGATGIQVGTLFAYCEESGLAEYLKRSVLAHASRGDVSVITDSRASPTGYPFKVVDWAENPARSAVRERICDLGYLRVAYRTPVGKFGYRCPAEPVEDFVRKGGQAEDTEGRQCLCNALMATIGHPQVRPGGRLEPPLVTSGNDLASISTFLRGRLHYRASDVLDYLLADEQSG